MDSTVDAGPSDALLARNLAALRNLDPHTVETLEHVALPASACKTIARDGENSYAWSDDEGRVRWLGRTSVPAVRAAALVDAFQPGTGNVLFMGLGSGGEVRRLLESLPRHQAILIIEPDALAAAMALRLHDYSSAIVAGRLLIFVGIDAWQAYEQFLKTHDGYALPDRILSWPYFTPIEAAALSQRVSTINSAITQARSEARAREPRGPVHCAQRDTAIIAILSNRTDASTLHVAARLDAAAANLGYAPLRIVPDSPRMIDPRAIAAVFRSSPPRRVILLDVAPDELPVTLPPCPIMVLCTHFQPLAQEWLARLPAGTLLGFRSPRQRADALSAGRDPATLIPVPAAAPSGVALRPAASPQRISLWANLLDPSPEAAGLHLASHLRIWATATELIQARIDAYQPGRADEILRQAERRLGIAIESAEVRSALVDRIRGHLAPALVRRAHLEAIRDRGFLVHASSADDLTDNTTQHDICVDLSEETVWRDATLEAILAGAIILRPATPSAKWDEEPGGEPAIQSRIHRFGGRADLIHRLDKLAGSPAEFGAGREEAAEEIRRRHTWEQRLKTILAA